VSLAVAVAAAAGCQPPPKPIKFQDTLTQCNLKLYRSTRPFRNAVLVVERGQQPNSGSIAGALGGVKKALEDVKVEAAGLSPPAGSSSGANYLAKYKDFLKGQDAIVKKMGEIAAVAEGPDDPADKAERINAMFKEIADEEQRARGELEQAQSEFATEHKLTLVQELSDKKK
jgi:hypothetical protein